MRIKCIISVVFSCVFLHFLSYLKWEITWTRKTMLPLDNWFYVCRKVIFPTWKPNVHRLDVTVSCQNYMSKINTVSYKHTLALIWVSDSLNHLERKLWLFHTVNKFIIIKLGFGYRNVVICVMPIYDRMNIIASSISDIEQILMF